MTKTLRELATAAHEAFGAWYTRRTLPDTTPRWMTDWGRIWLIGEQSTVTLLSANVSWLATEDEQSAQRQLGIDDPGEPGRVPILTSYLEAAQPRNILALCDALAAAREERDAARAEIGDLRAEVRAWQEVAASNSHRNAEEMADGIRAALSQDTIHFVEARQGFANPPNPQGWPRIVTTVAWGKTAEEMLTECEAERDALKARVAELETPDMYRLEGSDGAFFDSFDTQDAIDYAEYRGLQKGKSLDVPFECARAIPQVIVRVTRDASGALTATRIEAIPTEADPK